MNANFKNIFSAQGRTRMVVNPSKKKSKNWNHILELNNIIELEFVRYKIFFNFCYVQGQ